MLARRGDMLFVLDNTAHAVWTGRRCFAVDSGVEAMLPWGDGLLTLSGDTDCLTMFSLATGLPQLTIPAGVYPQDMYLLPGNRSLAVCGGADGLVRVIRLPELWEEQCIRLPGNVQRVTCLSGVLYALCTMEQEGLCCQLFRIQGGQRMAMARWPGLPGAIHADGLGRLWVASTESLCCFLHGEYRMIREGFGLIRHMASRDGMLLASDPVMDALWLVQDEQATCIYHGEIAHGIWA
jgi:hypothetical protein